MSLFSEFWTSPKKENRSKRQFAKFLPFAGLCDFSSPAQRYRAADFSDYSSGSSAAFFVRTVHDRIDAVRLRQRSMHISNKYLV